MGAGRRLAIAARDSVRERPPHMATSSIRTETGLVLVDTGTYTARAETFSAVRTPDERC